VITLVLGGARSGKSEVAERLAATLAPRIDYVATGPSLAEDADWARRVAQHRARRPPAWTTIELGPGGDLAAALRDATGPALVDSLGTWIVGLPAFGVDGTETATLCDRLVERRADGRATVVVSEEVGLGVHPSSEAGREFRDALGVLNRDVARVADAVHLVVAGRVLTLGRDSP
jgi:adenosylcobinamide kinase/adenosylcobinamide-phosphate guanylyltransferase